MGLKECTISLDNPWSSYYPGQTVNGVVAFTFDKPKKLRGISIQFKGFAETKWHVNEERRDHEGKITVMTVDNTASEEYFSISYYLLGNKSGSEIEIPAGTHSYPFTFALPPTLPSSFEGEFGHVRYTIKVTLDRPWKFDQETKMAFTVVSHMDLNTLPNAIQPIRMHMEKNFCCCWCKSGPLTVDIGLPVSGYCSGQPMPIEILCENGSNVKVNGFSLKLVKVVTYRCHTPSNQSKTVEIAIANLSAEAVPQNSTKTFNLSIEIPPLPPSNLLNCGIIDLDYILKASCEVSGLHMNMDRSAPIIIGTVPIVGFTGPPPPAGPTNMGPTIQISSDTPLLNNPYPTVSYPPQQGYPPELYPSASQPVSPYPVSGPVPSAPLIDNQNPGNVGMPIQPGQPNPQNPAYGQPVFREGQFAAKSIHDQSDNQHTRVVGNNEFTPMYPTYGFVAQ